MAATRAAPINLPTLQNRHSVLWLSALPIAEKIIKEYEGFRAEPYDDADGKPLSQKTKVVGIPTIGYGFTEKLRKGITTRTNISEAEASKILRDELLGKYGAPLAAAVKNPSMSPSQFAALLSLSWNAGPTAVVKSDVLKLLNEGKTKEAAQRVKSWYVTSKGKKMAGLVRRREAEAELILGGGQSSNRVASVPIRMFRAMPPAAKVASVGVIAVAVGAALFLAWQAAQNATPSLAGSRA